MSKENQIPSEILYLLFRKTGNDVAPLQVPRCQKFPLKSQKVHNYLTPTHPPHPTTFPKENQIPLTTEKEAKSSTIFAAAAAESRGQSSSPSVVRNIRTWISQTLFWSVTLNFCSF
ncbi:hypothetical protein Peur_021095 [Populus x canadensis]